MSFFVQWLYVTKINFRFGDRVNNKCKCLHYVNWCAVKYSVGRSFSCPINYIQRRWISPLHLPQHCKGTCPMNRPRWQDMRWAKGRSSPLSLSKRAATSGDGWPRVAGEWHPRLEVPPAGVDNTLGIPPRLTRSHRAQPLAQLLPRGRNHTPPNKNNPRPLVCFGRLRYLHFGSFDGCRAVIWAGKYNAAGRPRGCSRVGIPSCRSRDPNRCSWMTREMRIMQFMTEDADTVYFISSTSGGAGLRAAELSPWVRRLMVHICLAADRGRIASWWFIGSEATYDPFLNFPRWSWPVLWSV